MKKRVLTLALAIVLVFSLCSGAFALSAADFTDVQSSDWFYEAVDYVATHEFMNGVSATEFAPKEYVTRAMVPTVLARVDGTEVDNAAECRFADVASNLWYTGAVIWGDEKAIVKGDGTNFMPGSYVKREDVAVFVARYLDVAYYKSPNKDVIVFTDEDEIADYADAAVDLCTTTGIINGYPDGTFLPKQYMTRAEFAAVIMRLHIILTTPPVVAPVAPTGYYVVLTVKGTPVNDTALVLTSDKYPTASAINVVGLAEDLTGTINENNQAITNAFTSLLSRVYNHTANVTLGTTNMDVTIDSNGVISAIDTSTSAPVDLQTMVLTDWDATYASKYTGFKNKIEADYSISVAGAADTALEALYLLGSPACYVDADSNPNNLKLKSAAEYYALIAPRITAAADFRSAYAATEAQYEQGIQLAKDLMSAYKVGYTVNGNTAEVLASEAVFSVCGGANSNFFNAVIVNAADETADYATIAGKVNTFLATDILPATLPSSLTQFLGEYSVNVAVVAYY